MKIIYKETIGDYTVIRTIASALVDSEQTKEKIAGLITPELLARAKMFGAADYIRKPFEPEVLRERATEVLGLANSK